MRLNCLSAALFVITFCATNVFKLFIYLFSMIRRKFIQFFVLIIKNDHQRASGEGEVMN